MAQFRYPSGVDGSNSSYISFTRLTHKGVVTGNKLRNINNSNNFTGISAADFIVLPMPNNFSDTMSANYSDISDMYYAPGGFSEVATKIAGIAESTGLGNTLKQVKEASTQSREGAIQQAVFFDNIGIKTYTWSWDLIPETLKEAQDIEQIVHQLQLAMLPTVGDSISLNFPDIIKVRAGGVNSKLVRFLPGVITNIEFTPTPNGYYQIYKTGHFPHIQFSVTFSEFVSRTRELQSSLYNQLN